MIYAGRPPFHLKQSFQEINDAVDLSASAQPSPALKGMPPAPGPGLAVPNMRELATYGQAAPSAVSRMLPGQEAIAEAPSQQAERLQTLHQPSNQERRLEMRGAEVLGGQMRTAPASLAQTAADLQRQQVGIALQGERGDRTAVAPPSAAALNFAVKKIGQLGGYGRQPSVFSI